VLIYFVTNISVTKHCILSTQFAVNRGNKDSKESPKVSVIKKYVETETGAAEVYFVYVFLMDLTINRVCVLYLFLISSRAADGNCLRKV
jgi:hypothetical protein